MFDRNNAEITAFIRDGVSSDSDDRPAPALSSEARALMQSLRGASAVPDGSADDISGDQQSFLENIGPWAKQAGQQLGVAPELVLAHAALESGWGQHPLRTANGSSSHNLFGIKAGRGWQGAVTNALTTEHFNGADIKTTQRFRAYPDFQSAFQDYAHLLKSNPRFAGALNVGSNAEAFASALQRAGYATDPHYADKLQNIARKLSKLLAG
ncbi:flagellar assembly peptidoglycan hydrolase FlgJ [Paludibacterium denitrificans]|uniref:Flagellar assembly peptidoglycan hydrolase FlgJ n=1 Tax=Paludibacterium denitrificans TaxID=2675226 RepID=A0A844GAV4_9NEIS|nr:flagellar assembly peptidoglycan hydrolase FlgJ [Paludibacterium denitrificans]MTD32912.1 flagellar assembly peptidoglycan hydrolase FlgJ [Paludibacterium denitrificans]